MSYYLNISLMCEIIPTKTKWNTQLHGRKNNYLYVIYDKQEIIIQCCTDKKLK